ncbi:MAG: stage II sporulation protein P [Oliverpabstia sp.]|nr:stage II sporulation protein P [Eubacterium sp.]MDY2596762.1 stage II sporulation protein P [Oliverpabstia sp.]
MSGTEKILNSLLWILVVGLGGYLTAKGLIMAREKILKNSDDTIRYVYQLAEEDMIALFLPIYNYEESEEHNDNVWRSVWKQIPLIGYLWQENQEEILVEDESTCHEIIDANGKTITERLLAENQGNAVTEENYQEISKKMQEESGTAENGQESAENQQTQQEEMGENGNSQLPAWTTAVEMAPSVDLSQESLGNFDYVLNHFFVVDPNTTIDSSQLNAAALLDDDLTLEVDGENPQILIYHTHSQEGYIDSVPGDENTTVIGVGNYLESLLRDVFGYQVIHMKDAFDMANGTLERSKAYNYALPAVEKVLEENPSVQVVIDLHRDGVPDDRHLVTEINGKPTAQIMYFNGLSRTVSNGSLDSLPNPYIEDNLAFAFQMSVQAARYYPELTRCIYLKGYRYNLHVRPRSMLLEVGAQTNTVEEAMNAMEPFSVILNKVLRGE